MANKILFRASSVGHIMADPKLKSETISEGCKTHLVDIFIQKKYGRKTDITNRYTIKGTQVEEDSMTLFSRVKREFYVKNEESLTNDFITGTPDIITSLSVDNMEIIDIKSSWDIYTFFRSKHKEINKLYYWQLQSYMALTGAKKSRLAYCLVNTPDQLIEGEKRKLWYAMGQPNTESELYLQGCNEVERMCLYDDIPKEERVHEFIIDRDDAMIEKMYNRTIECNKWMDENLFKVPERIDIEGI